MENPMEKDNKITNKYHSLENFNLAKNSKENFHILSIFIKENLKTIYFMVKEKYIIFITILHIKDILKTESFMDKDSLPSKTNTNIKDILKTVIIMEKD